MYVSEEVLVVGKQRLWLSMRKDMVQAYSISGYEILCEPVNGLMITPLVATCRTHSCLLNSDHRQQLKAYHFTPANRQHAF